MAKATLADAALSAYEEAEAKRREEREALERERVEREKREAAARDAVCRPILDERLGRLPWDVHATGGDPARRCWVVYRPADGSTDLKVVAAATHQDASEVEVEGYNGVVAVAEYRTRTSTGEPSYGKRLHTLADLGQAIHDREQHQASVQVDDDPT